MRNTWSPCLFEYRYWEIGATPQKLPARNRAWWAWYSQWQISFNPLHEIVNGIPTIRYRYFSATFTKDGATIQMGYDNEIGRLQASSNIAAASGRGDSLTHLNSVSSLDGREVLLSYLKLPVSTQRPTRAAVIGSIIPTDFWALETSPARASLDDTMWWGCSYGLQERFIAFIFLRLLFCWGGLGSLEIECTVSNESHIFPTSLPAQILLVHSTTITEPYHLEAYRSHLTNYTTIKIR